MTPREQPGEQRVLRRRRQVPVGEEQSTRGANHSRHYRVSSSSLLRTRPIDQQRDEPRTPRGLDSLHACVVARDTTGPATAVALQSFSEPDASAARQSPKRAAE